MYIIIITSRIILERKYPLKMNHSKNRGTEPLYGDHDIITRLFEPANVH